MKCVECTFLLFGVPVIGSSASSTPGTAPATAPESRIPQLPPIRDAIPSGSVDDDDEDMNEMKDGLKNINSVAAR